MGETEIAQPANFAIQVALAAQWRMRHRPRRGGGAQRRRGRRSPSGRSAHVRAGGPRDLPPEPAPAADQRHGSHARRRPDAERLLRTLDRHARRVRPAGVGGRDQQPVAVTIAGDGDVLDEIARQLDEAGVFNRYLAGQGAVSHALHGPGEGRPARSVRRAVVGSRAVPLYSTVTGEQLTGYSAGAAYWWQNIRATVLFEPALRRMLDDGYTHFVELGPHPVLASSILEIAGTQAVSVLASQRRNDDDEPHPAECVGALHGNGHDVAWEALNPRRGREAGQASLLPVAVEALLERDPGGGETCTTSPCTGCWANRSAPYIPPGRANSASATVADSWPTTRCRAPSWCPARCSSRWPRPRRLETYGADLQRRRSRTAPRPDPRRHLRSPRQDHARPGQGHPGVRRVHGDRRRRLQVDADGDRRTEHAAPVAPAAATAVEARHQLDERRRASTPAPARSGSATATRSVPSPASSPGPSGRSAEIDVPAEIADELDAYRFHPALVDSAFQTLFGTRFVA